jgi:hypothetical protein
MNELLTNSVIATSQRQHRYSRQLSRLKNLPGGHSAVEPPDPMPNSEVKRGSADGSVAFAMRE